MDLDLDNEVIPDVDGLRKRSAHIKENGSLEKLGVLNGFRKHAEEDVEEETEDEPLLEDNTGTKASQSVETSPSHSWKSNSSTNLFEEDEDYEGEGEGGDCDDYEYDPYSHEYVPKIREPPAGEDSDDGLLVSRETRDASLSVIAQALLDSARMNQEKHDKEKQRYQEGGGSLLEKFLLLCQGTRKLRKIEEMPSHLQFNKHIHSGYRELHDFWGCVSSLGYVHNETFNILTHVAPIVYILMYWCTMYPWQHIEGNTFLNILGWSHIFASISPWAGSVVYHLFMSHHNGEKFYQFLLQVDMFGIWITECFGALTNLSAASWCLPHDFQTAIMTAYGLAAAWGLQKALTAWTPMARRMCFAPVFTFRILAFVLRLSPWGGGDPNILMHVILQDVLSIAGGIIGVVRIPEKWFPGKLDLVFNSHHIMHILVVVAVIHMNMASNGDINWIINNYSQSQCSKR